MKVELYDIKLAVSPLTDTIHAGVIDRRDKSSSTWLHHKDVTADFLRCIVDRLKDEDGAELELRVNGQLRYTVKLIAAPREGALGGPSTQSEGPSEQRGARETGGVTTATPKTSTGEARIAELEGALKEIEKGEGAFSRDPLTHASNVIDAMKSIATRALLSPPK